MHRALVLSVAVLAGGCAADNELGARYQLERRCYEARLLEQAAYATYPVDDYRAWRVAVDAYQAAVRSNPARIPESADWDPARLAEMERIALGAEIGLLRLAVVDYRFHAAVSHPRVDVSATPSRFGRLELPRARALYDSAGADPAGERCLRRLRAVASNPALWKDTTLLRDSLLAAPAALLARGADAAEFAEGFYTRVITTWPDSAAAARARDYRAGVRIFEGRYADAVADLEAAIASHPDPRRRHELALERCDLLAFHLERRSEAIALLRDIIERDPAATWAWQARTRLAVLAPPDTGAGEQLRAIHMDARAPAGVAAAALFARAHATGDTGQHEEAEHLYWRLTQRFPDTTPALAAPLRVIASALERGDRQGSRRTLTRAREYYLDVLARGSAAVDPPFLALDCLVEACLAAGTPEEASAALQDALGPLSGDGVIAAHIKIATIEASLLGRLEKSGEMLEKALVLDPGSRYAMCGRWILVRTREAHDGHE